MMDYSFLAARLSFTFMSCIFFSCQINSAAAAMNIGIIKLTHKFGGLAGLHWGPVPRPPS